MSTDPTPPDGDVADQLAALGSELERLARRFGLADADRDQLAEKVDNVLAAAEALTVRADTSDGRIADAEKHIKAVGDVLKKILGSGALAPFGWLLRRSSEQSADDPSDGGKGGPSDGASDGPGPLGAEEAAKRLDDLQQWVSDVYLRYGGTELTACWAWHPDVVEELLWLRGAHKDAYVNRGASNQKVGDWHERWRPGVVRRVAGYLSGCEMTKHRRELGAPVVPLAAHLPAVAAVWADRHELLAPTVLILGQAEAYEQQQARRARA